MPAASSSASAEAALDPPPSAVTSPKPNSQTAMASSTAASQPKLVYVSKTPEGTYRHNFFADTIGKRSESESGNIPPADVLKRYAPAKTLLVWEPFGGVAWMKTETPSRAAYAAKYAVARDDLPENLRFAWDKHYENYHTLPEWYAVFKFGDDGARDLRVMKEHYDLKEWVHMGMVPEGNLNMQKEFVDAMASVAWEEHIDSATSSSDEGESDSEDEEDIVEEEVQEVLNPNASAVIDAIVSSGLVDSSAMASATSTLPTAQISATPSPSHGAGLGAGDKAMMGIFIPVGITCVVLVAAMGWYMKKLRAARKQKQADMRLKELEEVEDPRF
jgi:hypothetical protein